MNTNFDDTPEGDDVPDDGFEGEPGADPAADPEAEVPAEEEVVDDSYPFPEIGKPLAPELAAKVMKAMKQADPAEAAILKKEWPGDDMAVNLGFAHAATEAFADPALIKFLDSVELNGQPLGSHPLIIKAAARIGRAMAAEAGDPRSVGKMTPKQEAKTMAEQQVIQEQIDQIHELQETDPRKYWADKTQRKLQALYGKMPGAKTPIVGREQRNF